MFDKIQKPYFRHKVLGDSMVGEDILFCRTMVDLGVEIYCDMDLSRELRHLGTHGYNMVEMLETMEAQIQHAAAAE